MKANIKYFAAAILFFFISFLNLQSIISQTFQGNVPIVSTDGGGAMIGDIIKTQSHVFVYSLEKITAYNMNGSYAGEIVFNLPQKYGSFNPLFFWDPMYSASTATMAYNENPTNPILYAIAPDLTIYIIDLDASNFLNYQTHEPAPIPPPPPEPLVPLDDFKPLHGNCILKYDPAHDRLFWVIDAQNEAANNTGSHHVRQRYFFIFDVVNTVSGAIEELFSEHEYSSTGNYSYAGIQDVEINQLNSLNNPDYFYLSKNSALEVWKITKDNPPEIQVVNTYNIPDVYNCPFYKTSLKYIYDSHNGIHKIIAFPYMFPGCVNFTNPDFFVLDGGHDTSIVWTATASPSGKITDIEYLENLQHLMISYASDPMSVVPPYNPNKDISIFEFMGDSLSFLTEFSTDESETISTMYDFNTPIDIVPVSGSSVMLCKEDEISFVYYDYTENVYQSESTLIRENNIFGKGVSFDNNNKFVLNATANGIQLINNAQSPGTFHQHGFQANHICMNNDGSKFYLFNKLNTYYPACYIFDGDNAYNLNNPFINPSITAPIGDCIYNPFLDHFIISENAYFTDSVAAFKVFDNNDDLILTKPLSEDDGSFPSFYARNMFIDPNGYLYVMADMNYVQGQGPTLFIFSAYDGNYTLIKRESIQNMPTPGNYHDFYYAHFCYNQYNDKVYATINSQMHLLTPYESSANSLIISPTGSGLLIEISDNQISGSVELADAGKIICPDNGSANPSGRYGENMFVIGTYFHEISPPYNDPQSVSMLTGMRFNDIVYNTKHDMLFALEDDQDTNVEHRISKVYTIKKNNNDVWDKYLVLEEGGQASSLIHNPYDNMIYMHQKMDEFKEGEIPVKLFYFDYDPDASTQLIGSISLEITCTYPEFDHNEDEIKNLRFYNITTPAINPNNNTIYIPNGAHGCVSKVSFDANERVLLNEEDNQSWRWLSFPRLDRQNNAAVDVDDVLGGNHLYPNNYQENSKLTYYAYNETPQGTTYDFQFNKYTNSFWSGSQGDLDVAKSTLGYKLNLIYTNPDPVWLFMEGTVFNSNLSNDLPTLHTRPDASFEYFDNWVGYYLYQEQYPFDAISADDLEHIYAMRGQYWACAKFWGDGIPQLYWVCQCAKGHSERIKYGDMVILKTYQEIEDFQWQQANQTNLTNVDRPPTQYFSFTEQSDYIPIFIELDSAVNPLEIGAFVDDSCVGATTVFPTDSIVLIQAYTEGINGEIYFESHYSNKSMALSLKDYLIASNVHKDRIKKRIHTAETEDYYLVSFNDVQKQGSTILNNHAYLQSYPNPINSDGKIVFYTPSKEIIELSLYNVMGEKQETLYSGMTNEGRHEIAFSVESINGGHLKNGTYILILYSKNWQTQAKIVVLR